MKEIIFLEMTFWTVSHSGLLRTWTSSPSEDFEALVLALLVLADVLVFVMAYVYDKQKSEIKTRNIRTGTRNFGILGLITQFMTDDSPIVPWPIIATARINWSKLIDPWLMFSRSSDKTKINIKLFMKISWFFVSNALKTHSAKFCGSPSGKNSL